MIINKDTITFENSEFREFVLGFCDHILDRKITVCRSMDDKTEYYPPEYDLLRGQLKMSGVEMLKEYIDTI